MNTKIGDHASDLHLLRSGAVFWFRRSEWGVSGHRNSVSQVFGIAGPCSLRDVETSPCHHRRPGRPVPVRGGPRLRRLPRLDQQAHDPLPPRGRGGVRAAVSCTGLQPGATPPHTVELVLRLRKELTQAGLDAGADTIGWHLTHHHTTTLSRARINRILVRAGASDFTHYRLQDSTRHVTNRGGIRRIREGTDVEILTWLDDCSRYALSVTAHRPVTGPVVLATFRTTAATRTRVGSARSAKDRTAASTCPPSSRSARLIAWPNDGSAKPGGAFLRMLPANVRANVAVVAVAPNGQILLNNAAGTTNVLVDILGYYR